MRKVILLSILSFLLVTTFISNAVAQVQVPRTLNYQANLRGEGNIPINRTVPIIFSIYEQELGGAPLWTELQDVTVVNGYINVYLGTITELNLTFDKQYWLEITVGNGTPYPRTPLTSVGSAIRSVYSSYTDTAGYAEDIKDGIVTQQKLAPGVKAIPWGPAGGDLEGEYPNPTIKATAVLDKIGPGSITQDKLAKNICLPPCGPASGDLTGSYPDPLIAPGAVKEDRIFDGAVTTDKIRNGAIVNSKIALGAVHNTNISAGNAAVNSVLIVDNNGNVVWGPPIPGGQYDQGDLYGSYLAPLVDGIHGRPILNNAPTNGQAYVWNGNAWTPSNLIGDITGPLTNNWVSSIQGVPVSAPLANDGEVYMYDNGQIVPALAGGDVTGAYNDLTVVRWRNVPIDDAILPTTTGEIYMYDELAGEWVIAQADGDVSGLYNNLRVDNLQGVPLNAAGAQGNFLVFNNNMWAPANASGDVNGGFNTLQVDKIKGRDVSNNAPVVGQNYMWDGAAWTPTTAAGDVTGAYNALRVEKWWNIPIEQKTVPQLNTGDIYAFDQPSSSFKIAQANGDVTGRYNALSVVKLRGFDISPTPPQAGSVYMYNGAAWIPAQADGDVEGFYNNLQIKAGAVGEAEIANGAVTNPKLALNAVTSDKILDGEVKNGDIANGAVDHNKIGAGEVYEANIATGAVTNTKLGNNAVTSDKILDGEVKNGDIANGAVDHNKIGVGEVYETNIATGAVTNTKLGLKSVKAANVDPETATKDFALVSDGGGNAIWAKMKLVLPEIITQEQSLNQDGLTIRKLNDGNITNPWTAAIYGLNEDVASSAGVFKNITSTPNLNARPALYAWTNSTHNDGFAFQAERDAGAGQYVAKIADGLNGAGRVLFLDGDAPTAFPYNSMNPGGDIADIDEAVLVVRNQAADPKIAIKTYGDIVANSSVYANNIWAYDKVVVGTLGNFIEIKPPAVPGGPLEIDGDVHITGELEVDEDATFHGNAFVDLDLAVGGDVNITGKGYSALTVAADPANTLSTKSYVDASVASISADNGITENPANNFQLGGTLIHNTTIAQGDFDMIWNLNGTGNFRVQDNGVDAFVINDLGNVNMTGTLTAPTGNITTVNATTVAAANFNGGTFTGTPALTGGTIANAAITGGTINNTVIGGTTPAAGTFTDITTTNDANIGNQLNVTNDAIVGGDLTVVNDADVFNDLTVGNDLTITNNTYVGWDIFVNNDAVVGNDLDVTNDATVGNNLDVTNDLNVGNNAIVVGDVSAATFTGGSFTGTTVNANTVTATNFNGGTFTGTPALTGGTIAGATITGGSINNTPIGAVTPNTGIFTTVVIGDGTPALDLLVNGDATVTGTLTAGTILGPVGFNQITTGTNTSATMTVGTGATLTFTGTGVVNANQFNMVAGGTNAVDLNTAEVAGILPKANLPAEVAYEDESNVFTLLNIFNNGLTVNNAGTALNNGLTVLGGAQISGGVVIPTGGLNVQLGGATIAGGLDITTGNLNVSLGSLAIPVGNLVITTGSVIVDGITMNGGGAGKVVNPLVTTLTGADNAGTLTPKGYVDALAGGLRTPEYFVKTASAELDNERVLTFGAGFNTVDGGAGNPYTVTALDPSATNELITGFTWEVGGSKTLRITEASTDWDAVLTQVAEYDDAIPTFANAVYVATPLDPYSRLIPAGEDIDGSLASDVEGNFVDGVTIKAGAVGNTEINDATTFVDVMNGAGVSQFNVTDGNQELRFAGAGITNVAFNPATHTVTFTSTEVDPEVQMTNVNAVPRWNGTALVDGLMTDNGLNTITAGGITLNTATNTVNATTVNATTVNTTTVNTTTVNATNFNGGTFNGTTVTGTTGTFSAGVNVTGGTFALPAGPAVDEIVTVINNNDNTALPTEGAVWNLAVSLWNEPYVTWQASANLTNENVLAEGNGIDIVLGGGNATVSVEKDATLAFTGTTLGINLANANHWTATQWFDDVNIDGGTIDGTVIGGTTPAAGTFTDITTTNDANIGNQLNVTNDAIVGGDLTVVNDADVFNDLTVGNDLTITNNTYVGWDIFVNNDAVVGNDLDVTNDATVGNNLDVTNDLNVGNNAIVVGDVSAATFTGGSFTGTTVNANTVTATNFNGGTFTGTPALTGGTIAGATITGGSINNTPIGAVTPNTGIFTTVVIGDGTPALDLLVNGDATVTGTLTAGTILGPVGFNQITTGTNTSATMTVGTGATLTFTGTGVVNANQFNMVAGGTNAVDLNTAEVAGILPKANLPAEVAYEDESNVFTLLNIFNNGLTVNNAGTALNNGLTVLGGAQISGGVVIPTGGLNVQLGGATIAGGLDITTGNLNVSLGSLAIPVGNLVITTGSVIVDGITMNGGGAGKVVNPLVTTLTGADNAGTLTPKGYVDALAGGLRTPEYFVKTASAELDNERVLTFGAGFNTVDGGAGNPYTVTALDPSATNELITGFTWEVGGSKTLRITEASTDWDAVLTQVAEYDDAIPTFANAVYVATPLDPYSRLIPAGEDIDGSLASDVEGNFVDGVTIKAGAVGNTEINDATTFVDVMNGAGVSQFNVTDGNQELRFAGAGITNVAFNPATHTVTFTSTEVDPEVQMTNVNAVPRWNGTALVDGLMTDNGLNTITAGGITLNTATNTVNATTVNATTVNTTTVNTTTVNATNFNGGTFNGTTVTGTTGTFSAGVNVTGGTFALPAGPAVDEIVTVINNNDNTALPTEGAVWNLAVSLWNEPYVTWQASANLTNENVLAEGNGIDIVLGGGNATVSVEKDATLAFTGTTLGINLANANHWTATQWFDDVNIDGGTIDGTVIGGTTAAAGTFTTVNATTVAATNFNGGTFTGTPALTGGTIANAAITGGTIDGTVIGGTTAAAGTFTNLTANTNFKLVGSTYTALDGAGLINNGGVLDVNTGAGISIVGDAITALDPSATNELITATNWTPATKTLTITEAGTPWNTTLTNVVLDSDNPAAGDVTGSYTAGFQVTDDSHNHTGLTVNLPLQESYNDGNAIVTGAAGAVSITQGGGAPATVLSLNGREVITGIGTVDGLLVTNTGSNAINAQNTTGSAIFAQTTGSNTTPTVWIDGSGSSLSSALFASNNSELPTGNTYVAELLSTRSGVDVLFASGDGGNTINAQNTTGSAIYATTSANNTLPTVYVDGSNTSLSSALFATNDGQTPSGIAYVAELLSTRTGVDVLYASGDGGNTINAQNTTGSAIYASTSGANTIPTVNIDGSNSGSAPALYATNNDDLFESSDYVAEFTTTRAGGGALRLDAQYTGSLNLSTALYIESGKVKYAYTTVNARANLANSGQYTVIYYTDALDLDAQGYFPADADCVNGQIMIIINGSGGNRNILGTTVASNHAIQVVYANNDWYPLP